MYLVERVATDAPLLSHHCHMKIVFPLKLVWAVQKGGNQIALNPDCKQLFEGFQCVGCSVGAGVVVQQRNFIWKFSSSFRADYGFQISMKHVTICCTCDNCSTLLMRFENRPLRGGCRERSASVTIVRPFSNISIHSYTILRERTLSPYWAHMQRWICAPGTPTHKKRVTDHCSSLVQFISFTAIFTTAWQLSY
jgi:hypothetical protein